MLSKLWSSIQSRKAELAIIDSQFPQKTPMGFRNVEINEYLNRVDGAKAYAMYPMLPGIKAWFVHGYGRERNAFQNDLKGYLSEYPENQGKIFHLSVNKRYNFSLAYTYFLAETYVLLPFLDKQKVPFVFVLYPGGAFGLNNKSSDKMLEAVFASPYFREVIVTQKVTEEYLLKKNLCPKNKIHYIYGGFVQFYKDEILQRRRYYFDKTTLDVCFVAAKYSQRGEDKGYDLFIKAAKNLHKIHDDIQFHVVGNFDKQTIPVKELDGSIRFYGYLAPKKMLSFYREMDILLSPVRVSKLYEGSFDGFPLGIDASYCGVPLFLTDPIGLNRGYFTDSKDIVIVKPTTEDICKRILYYYDSPDELRRLSLACQRKTASLFSIEKQISERLKVLAKYTTIRNVIERDGGRD